MVKPPLLAHHMHSYKGSGVEVPHAAWALLFSHCDNSGAEAGWAMAIKIATTPSCTISLLRRVKQVSATPMHQQVSSYLHFFACNDCKR